MSERFKFKDFLRTFKAMYQQIQGLNTEEKALEIGNYFIPVLDAFSKLE